MLSGFMIIIGTGFCFGLGFHESKKVITKVDHLVHCYKEKHQELRNKRAAVKKEREALDNPTTV